MIRKKPDVDIIRDIPELTLQATPDSTFVRSLLQQYQERGGLSKKQLQGLLHKARRVDSLPPAKLATLEAVILKKPTRYKSSLPSSAPLYEKNAAHGEMMRQVLERYPQHKRVIFFYGKYEANVALTPVEAAELERFHKLLIR